VDTLPEPAHKVVARDPLELCELGGIGKDLAGKIAEIATTGDLELHRELLRKVPAGLTVMMRVAGVGAKRAKLFYDQLHLGSLDELEAAAKEGRLHELRGIGEALEKRILQGCAEQHSRLGRFRVSQADVHAAPLVEYMKKAKSVEEISIAGSLRRRRETIGDLDLLVASHHPADVADHFCAYSEITKVLAHGGTKCSAVLRSGMQVDMRVIEPVCWGAALHYFTGSKAHNIAIRLLGVKRKLKINEYGVFKGTRRIGGRTEEEVFAAVGLPFIPPELREDRGEIQAARDGKLPRLVELRQIRGDLHMHTDATDGESTLREMVTVCIARGYEYVAVTDHTKAVRVAGGLDRRGLEKQHRAIEALRRELPDITILHGAEVDILEDGRLDLDEATLGGLDYVLAAVHSKLGMSEPAMTERVLAAMKNPRVNALAHPTGRLIGAREPVAIDLAKVLAAARDAGVFLEIDAHPERLDLSDAHIRMARDAGARLVIDSDAHRVNELDFIRYGVDQARRGWCTARDIVNTRPRDELLALIERRPRRRPVRHAHAAHVRT
jgi:DNA polymerase (family 10)